MIEYDNANSNTSCNHVLVNEVYIIGVSVSEPTVGRSMSILSCLVHPFGGSCRKSLATLVLGFLASCVNSK